MSFLADVMTGDSRSMPHVADGEAQLVLTSPPYFPVPLDPVLSEPVARQTRQNFVAREIGAFQKSLWPVLKECGRISCTGGILCMISADVGYGGLLHSVTGRLREGAEQAGYRLFTRVQLRPISYRRRTVGNLSTRSPRAFRFDETVAVEVFCLGEKPLPVCPEGFGRDELKSLSAPLWNMRPMGKRRVHPHQSPPDLLQKLIRLYSRRGDLVVDPFAGSGSTVVEAALLGRRGLGYEKDPVRADAAKKAVAKRVNTLVGGDS
jgi:site-specific DNA-methyltransferase (adenine-specific)